MSDVTNSQMFYFISQTTAPICSKRIPRSLICVAHISRISLQTAIAATFTRRRTVKPNTFHCIRIISRITTSSIRIPIYRYTIIRTTNNTIPTCRRHPPFSNSPPAWQAVSMAFETVCPRWALQLQRALVPALERRCRTVM